MAAFVLIFVRSGLAAAERIEPGQLPAPFELHPALELQLLVQEPNVVDPVALTFDADGRMYVVEMRDYPYGFGSERKPGGTVRLIEDLDGDGAFERATIFAEDLSFPTSIVPWKEGVLVAAPPQILFLRDTNGDGRADVREVIVQGFTLGVTDSNMNGLRWGLDHRVHGVNGGNGGRLTSPKKPEAILSISKADFSFDPDSGDITRTFQTSGGFGLVFDDWGRSFVTYNIDHIQHPIVPLRFLERFPGLPPQETTVSISDHGEMARIYPISVPETRVNHPEQSGHFSAAGGMGWIGAGIFPSELYGSILVCDVVGNLVHRDQLVPSGPIFRARRPAIEQEREFFASRDNAFRPVGLELGPDGALYLIDMQRDVIEHPDYIPKKVLEKLDIRAGEMRGRIYRIAPKGMRPVSFPKLAQAKTAVLLDELSSDNAWRRSTAQRLLLERQEKWAVPALKRIAREGKKPLSRLHALWTLRGLNALDESLLLRALRADEPGLRENALQLAETRLSASKPLQEAVLQLAEDPDVRVRFQAALMLGNIDEITAYRALAIILARDFEHRWSRLAVLSSLRTANQSAQLLISFLQNAAFISVNTPQRLDVIRELADLTGARAATCEGWLLSDVVATLRINAVPSWSMAVIEGFRSGVVRGGKPAIERLRGALPIEEIPARSRDLEVALWQLSRALGFSDTTRQLALLGDATRGALDGKLPIEERLAHIQVLGLGSYATVKNALVALLDSREPSSIQQAALNVFRQHQDREVARDLIDRWPELAPVVRTPVIKLLLERIPFHAILLNAIEAKKITLGELNLDLEQRRRLLRHSTDEVKARAANFIADEEYSNRKELVEEWLAKIPAAGDPARGRPIFEKLCASCHALGGLGVNVGPDLAQFVHRSVEDLLSNILDPNMAINPAYVSFTAETDRGEFESGILAAETAGAITLQQAGDKRVELPRQRIKRLSSSGLSLMPEGLEAGLSPQEVRDLIAFLQSPTDFKPSQKDRGF